MQDMLDNLTEIARKAGEAILEVYQKEDFGVEQKSDDSPLTQADLAAHKIISESLEKYTPAYPASLRNRRFSLLSNVEPGNAIFWLTR